MTLHVTGSVLRFSETSRSLQPARQVNAVVRERRIRPVNCPGCGSTLWNDVQCGACGRLASDTSPRTGPQPLTRAQRVGAAGIKGAIGGGIAGFLGGGPLNPGAVGHQLLLGLAVGAVAGVVLVVVASGGRLREAGWLWSFVPGMAAVGAFAQGAKRLVGWAWGFVVAQWAEGYIALAAGAAAGAALAAMVVFLSSAPRVNESRPAVPPGA
jgi:hypothetical protein